MLALALAISLSACQTLGLDDEPLVSNARYGKVVVAALRMPTSVKHAAETRMAAVLSQKKGIKVVQLSRLPNSNNATGAEDIVRLVINAGAKAVIVIDPFVFRENGKTVVRSIVLSGLRKASPDDVVGKPPLTYKAAIYDVDKVLRVWLDDINSAPSKKQTFEDLAAQAGELAIDKAIAANAL